MGEGSEDVAPTVRRVDRQLGLALRRVPLSPRSLVTYARHHVAVRTPSLPDLRDGNTLDLEQPPTPDELEGWVHRYERTVGTLGAPHVQLRWESPLPGDVPPEVPTPAPELVAACRAAGLELTARSALLLDELIAPPPAPVTFVPVAPPSPEAGGPVDRRWHAATVLYRYMEGDAPDDWRDPTGAAVARSIEVQRELALADRAQVWLAMRHGAPVGRLTVTHDRQGLATIDDVVVHPAHRRLGIAAALTHEAVARHLDVHDGDRVGIVAAPAGPAEHLGRGLGFRPHATLWIASRPAG